MARIKTSKKAAMVAARRLETCGSLIANAFILAKAGDAVQAGKILVRAAEDEQFFDEITESFADGLLGEEGDPIDELDIEFADEARCHASGDDDDDEEEEEDEDDEDGDDTTSEGCGDIDVPDDTAPEVREVAVGASLASLAKRLKENRY